MTLSRSCAQPSPHLLFGPPHGPLAAPAGEGLECRLPVGDCRLLGAPDWHGERRQRGAHPRCARCGGELALIHAAHAVVGWAGRCKAASSRLGCVGCAVDNEKHRALCRLCRRHGVWCAHGGHQDQGQQHPQPIPRAHQRRRALGRAVWWVQGQAGRVRSGQTPPWAAACSAAALSMTAGSLGRRRPRAGQPAPAHLLSSDGHATTQLRSPGRHVASASSAGRSFDILVEGLDVRCRSGWASCPALHCIAIL